VDHQTFLLPVILFFCHSNKHGIIIIIIIIIAAAATEFSPGGSCPYTGTDKKVRIIYT